VIDFRQLSVGPLETNCYIVWDRDTRKAAVIDPGGDDDLIAQQIARLELDVEWVLITHGHLDHCFSAGPIARKCGAGIGMHPDDIEHLIGGLEIAALYYDISAYERFTPTRFLTDGDVISLGNSEISVIHTPGHSQGGLCFATDAGVFCGDTVFAGSVGRTDFPGGSFEQLIESIRTKILTMDDSTRLYPGHGPATSVGEERRSNPFLQQA
jgi:glyoxylase-like metal-dependent hydrolase (beta-lactamase superfamily II)